MPLSCAVYVYITTMSRTVQSIHMSLYPYPQTPTQVPTDTVYSTGRSQPFAEHPPTASGTDWAGLPNAVVHQAPALPLTA